MSLLNICGAVILGGIVLGFLSYIAMYLSRKKPALAKIFAIYLAIDSTAVLLAFIVGLFSIHPFH